jgi:hypothetical protein
MLDYRPDIVHFCGHGLWEEGVVVEDEGGQVKLVEADALAGFFELFSDKVECVVLNACYSEVQAEAIARHIPYVIGMKNAISDAAAIEFAVAFYDALGAGRTIEFAYNLACNATRWEKKPENLTSVLHKSTSRLHRRSEQPPASLFPKDSGIPVEVTVRGRLKEFPEDPALGLEDWEPFCQSAGEEGVEVITEFVNIPPRLPKILEEARERLIPHVPDEHSLENPGAPFNGPCYYLRSFIPEVRRRGERPGCVLQFGPSDYRTFLVTNGMNAYWAKLAGLADEWESPNLDRCRFHLKSDPGFHLRTDPPRGNGQA